MAEVYRARGRGADGTEYLYAVKRILPEYTRDPEIKRMFIEESRVAACLVHPSVVRVYDLATTETDDLYIIMEFLEGKDLSEAIEEAEKVSKPLPIWFAIQIAREVLRALQYVTNEATDRNGRVLGLIHRDISPHNIFVCFDGQVKLTDFGVAKVAESNIKTQVGITKGKLGYMSPEQLMGHTLDFRSDLYNVGILLFESITGRQLFSGASTAEFLQAMVRGVVPAIPPALQVPPDLEACIRRALDRDRTMRPATALEFERELGMIAERYNLTAQSAHVAHQMRELYPRPAAPPMVKPATAPQKLKSMMLATLDPGQVASLAQVQPSARPVWQPAKPKTASQGQVQSQPSQPASQPQPTVQARPASQPQPTVQARPTAPQPTSPQPPAQGPLSSSPYAKAQSLPNPAASGAAIDDDDFATIVRPAEPGERPGSQPSRPLSSGGLSQPRVQVAVSSRMQALPGSGSSGFDGDTFEKTSPISRPASDLPSEERRRPATVARGNARPLESVPSIPRPSASRPVVPPTSAPSSAPVPTWQESTGEMPGYTDRTRIEPLPQWPLVPTAPVTATPTAPTAPTTPAMTPTQPPPRQPTVQVGGSAVGVRSKRVVPLDEPKG